MSKEREVGRGTTEGGRERDNMSKEREVERGTTCQRRGR